MNTYLISDIHGQFNAFQQAISQVGFHPQNGDRLIVIGDVIDRGPQSRECFLYIYHLQRQYPNQIIYLKGNHEQMFEDWLKGKKEGEIFFLNGGDATIRSFLGQHSLRRAFLGDRPSPSDQDVARQEILQRYPFLLRYLETMPLYVEEPAHEQAGTPQVLFVHAGIRPNIPLRQQNKEDLLWIREDFWFHYDGRPLIVFGHTPVKKLPDNSGRGIWNRGNMIGIDGGAAMYDGGVLIVEWPSLRWEYVPNRSEDAPVVTITNQPATLV